MHFLGVYVSYLTSADLTRVIGWMETITWTVHSALKHAVCAKNNSIRLSSTKAKVNLNVKPLSALDAHLLTSAHRATLSGHAEEVDAGRQTAYLRAGGHTVHTHTRHTGGGVCEPAAALFVLLASIHTTWEAKLNHFLLRLYNIYYNIYMFRALLTSTAGTAGSWVGHLMHTRQLGTLRKCTMHLTCLQERNGLMV